MHDKLTFYWTVASGSSRKAIRTAGLSVDKMEDELTTRNVDLDPDDVPEPEFAMVSHATKMNEPWDGPDWMIDSGGYSTLNSNASYETDVEEYIDYLLEHESKISRYVLRDWACEDELLRKYDRTVRDHQKWTIRDHIKCREQADAAGLDAEPVAVLQGYDIRDYLWHYDYLREHGLLTDHLGIGSVCRRNSEAQLRSTIVQLREEIPDRITLHGFGVKQTLLGYPDVVDALNSVDTAAWNYGLRMDAEANNSAEGHRNTWNRNLEAYIAYREKITGLLDAVEDGDGTSQITRIGNWSATPDVPDGTYPMVECLCGTVLDPNSLINDDLPDPEPACRHCERFIMSLWDRNLDPHDEFGTPDDEVVPDPSDSVSSPGESQGTDPILKPDAGIPTGLAAPGR